MHQKTVGIFKASRHGSEVILALLTIVGAFSGFDFFLNGWRWNDPVLLLVAGSGVGAVFCLRSIFGSSVLLNRTKAAVAGITSSIFGVLAVAAPLAGWLIGNLYSRRRHGYESGEQSLVHLFEYAGISWLGIGVAVLLASVAFCRRERGRWLAVLGIILDWPLSILLNYLFFW